MAEKEISTDRIKHPAEIDRVKNIEKSPCDMRKDCRKDFSSIGPRMKAMIKGAGSY
jgi:hypothetical protein